jgi:thioredoxin reductase (NADPH)
MLHLFLLTLTLTQAPRQEDIVIVGSGPSGMTAAIYAARSDYSTLVVEGDESGGQITKSYKIENFPGFPDGISGYDLYLNMKKQAEKFNAKFIPEKVQNIDFSKRPFLIKLESGETIVAKALILAAGTEKKWLNLPNEKKLIGNGVNACALCDGPFFKGKEVAVVGGGDSAFEDAIYLANFASKVTIIHRKESFKASTYLQNIAKNHSNIEFLTDYQVDDLKKDESDNATLLFLKNVKGNETFEKKVDALFVAIGNLPNTQNLNRELELDSDGYVLRKNSTSETSLEGVFASGDIADPRYKQAITAAGMGAASAIDAIRFLQKKGDEK